jgi:hypothetical protein
VVDAGVQVGLRAVAWPGTPGGAASPWWGDNVRLYVWVAIQAGTGLHWGPHAADRLDAGNVWASPAAAPGPTPPAGGLWIDVSCDVLEGETNLGGGPGNPYQAEAATAELVLRDPHRIYDPLNPDSPYQYGGRSRLGPGAAVLVFVEVLTAPTTVERTNLHSGTVDTWAEAWTPHPGDRRVRVVSSDNTKILVGLDQGEQPEVGAGDTTDARITRILTHYGYTEPTRLDPGTVTLAATTLAQSAWELIGRAASDEIGHVYLDPDGALQFHARSTWATLPDPVVTVGCAPGVEGYDIVTDAAVDAASLALTNSVAAARTGGTTVTATSTASITLYGERGHKRTDLGLADDAQVAAWATYTLGLWAFPRARITAVTLTPRFDPTAWAAVVGTRLVVDRARVLWTPPGETVTYDTTGRIFSVRHQFSHTSWTTTWGLAYADLYARIMHWGGHPFDRLDSGNVYR